MSERKYTDEEIIKALGMHSDEEIPCVGLCPYSETPYCGSDMARDALDLINRQKAEIERLTIELDAMRGAANSYKMHYEKAKAEIEEWKARANDWQNQYLKLIDENEIYQEHIDQDIIYAKAIKAEAIKEFAERLKANMCHGYPYLEIEEDLFRRDVDNLVAEMTEGK